MRGMRFVVISAVLLASLSPVSAVRAEAADGAQVVSPAPAAAQAQGCGCADRADLQTRLRAVQAVIQLLNDPATGQAGSQPFDANAFDSGLGEGILMAQMSAGGIGAALPVADFDRYSCEINTVPLLGPRGASQTTSASRNVRCSAKGSKGAAFSIPQQQNYSARRGCRCLALVFPTPRKQ